MVTNNVTARLCASTAELAKVGKETKRETRYLSSSLEKDDYFSISDIIDGCLNCRTASLLE